MFFNKFKIKAIVLQFVKFISSFLSLQFLSVVCQKIVLKDKIEVGEDLFDFEFIEKHEEEMFKFINVALKQGPNSSEIERMGEKLIKLFVESSMKKLKSEIRKDKMKFKQYKGQLEKI